MTDLDITLTHTPAKALVILAYQDPDDPRPLIRFWIVGEDEEIPGDPEGFMRDLLYQDYREEDPGGYEDRQEFEDNLKFGDVTVMLLKG
jgi:hypothetical protein